MFKFGLKNLRRLQHVPLTELRPITVLVGRNSSGKSSFLRCFPLFRQSLMTRTSSPILWYGDFVDFGSFEQAVLDGDAQNRISFLFGLDSVTTYSRLRSSYDTYFRRQGTTVGPIEVEVEIAEHGNRTRLDGFKLRLIADTTTYDVSIDDNGHMYSIDLNGRSISDLYSDISVDFTVGSIFPDVVIRSKESEKTPSLFYSDNSSILVRPMRMLLRPYLDKRLADEQIDRMAYELLSSEDLSIKTLLDLSEKVNGKSFKKLLVDLATKDSQKLRERAREIYTANSFINIVGSVFLALRTLMSGILYIGPARARSERYYRYQDLAVSEIDSDGKNFPMFLNSLSERQLGSFSAWVKDRFGYGVRLGRSEGHISISLEVGKYVTNIVDTGYGISQILPVLGQIWWASNRTRGVQGQLGRSASTLLLVEQPELHLHPAHQALLADAMVGEKLLRGGASAGERAVQFVVETHSEALVNRLGELVAEGRILPSDVQILLFEASRDDDRRTNIRKAEFDSSGALLNWPYGFFEPQLSLEPPASQ